MPRLHSGAAIHRLETTETIPPIIPELVWQQPPDTSVETPKLVNTQNDTTIESNQTNHTPESQRVDIKPQTSPLNGTSEQIAGSDTEPIQEYDTMSSAVLLVKNSQNRQHEIRKTENDSTANNVRDDIIPPLTKTTPQNKNFSVRDEDTNELYMPLSSNIVLQRKKDAVRPSGFQKMPNNKCLS